ncbi:penicillin-binding protein [Ruminococcaceae bacterium OttesenSCG-928-A16]|nr:penicillin-binding protein [Ruminococcaceae bacterium OttesenSCG-928-A16]
MAQPNLFANKPAQAGRPGAKSGGNSAATRQMPSNGNGGAGGKKPPRKTTGGGGGKGGGKKTSVGKIIFFNILKAFLVLGCLAAMALAIVAIPLAQWITEETQSDNLNLLNLDTLKISQTSKIMYRDENGDILEYQTILGADTNTIWVGLQDMPIDMQNAAIAAEDREFRTHHGFSFWRSAYAALNQVFHFQRTFGASTLHQQLVKNITQEKETQGLEGIQRKILEIYRAWSLDKNYSKDTVMEAYLNTIPLSGTLAGVYTGAQQYFNKVPADLTIAECATIVGITNAPGRYDPYLNPEACMDRRNYVLRWMMTDGYITQAQFDEESSKPLGMFEGERQQQVSGTSINNYFVDTLYESVKQGLVDNGIAADLNEAHRLYYNGGLRIIATIDPKVQTAMEEVYEKGYGNQADGFIFPELTSPKVDSNGNPVEGDEVDYTQSAMVITDYNGALKGVVGGIGEKTANLTLNRAVDSVRQVGSTMKPIAAYPLGIDSGLITYSTILEDSFSQFRGKASYDAETGLPRYDWPTNFGNKVTNQPMLVTTALANSTNTIAVRVGERVGIDNMFEFLTGTLGVTSLVGEGDPSDRGYSALVLGGMTHGISPYELAGAYQMLGNEGVYTPVHCYEEVQDANGNVLFKFKGSSAQAIQPGTAYIMRQLLAGVLTSGGTANGMKPAGVNEAVAKTGTTGNADKETDRWFAGLTPDYVSIVWWGYDQNQTIKWSASARTNPPPMVWKAVMETLYADKAEQKSFPAAPEDLVVTAFCTETGYAATGNCPSQQRGYYLPERVPEPCYIHDAEAPAE